MTTLAQRIIELENEGLTTSDAQAVAEAEERAGRVFTFDPEHPMDGTPVFDSYGYPINRTAREYLHRSSFRILERNGNLTYVEYTNGERDWLAPHEL